MEARCVGRRVRIAVAFRSLAHRVNKKNATAVMRDLADGPNSRVVDLSWSGYTEKEWRDIFGALKTNTSCVELTCQGCNLEDADVKHLAEALKGHPSVQVLRLNLNRIGDMSVKHLAEALRQNTVLRVLCLPHCVRITDIGAKHLAIMLPCNHSLQEILLDGTGITNEGAQALTKAAARNCTLTKLTLNHFSWLTCKIYGLRSPKVEGDEQYKLDAAIFFRPTNLGSSNFNDKYAVKGQRLLVAEELYAIIRKIIVDYFAHDLGAERYTRIAAAIPFAVSLIDLLEQSGETDILKLAVKAWTSNEEQEGLTFYSIIQDCLRHDVDGDLMESIAKYCQTLNLFVVNTSVLQRPGNSSTPVSGAVPDAPWPTKTERGAWIPRDEVDWFKEKLGEVYRYAGYLATSSSPGTAKLLLQHCLPVGAANDLGEIDGKLPVKFHFHFEDQGCNHVNYLEHLTMVQGEYEWLFQHYSCFKVRSVSDLDGRLFTVDNPVEIHLEVQVNNMDHNLYLELARWH